MKILDPRAGYDLYAPNYRQDHTHLDSFDWAELQPLMAGYLSTALAHDTGKTHALLDLGCGDGRVLKRLVRLREQRGWNNRLTLHGWDISEGMLRQARKALPADLVLERHDLLDPMEGLPGFDLICSFFVLVHIGRPLDFLTAAARLLKPGGLLIFNNIPQREALVLSGGGQKFRIEYEHHEAAAILEAADRIGLELLEQRNTEWSQVFVFQNGTLPKQHTGSIL